MSLSYALLGFLNYSPMTGYDLKKVIDDSLTFFWSAHTSQIYRELKTLERDGAIISSVQPNEKGPDKRIYQITDSGKVRFEAWLSEAHTNETMRNDFLVWLLFSSQVDTDDLYTEMKKKLKEYQLEYQSILSIETRLDDYVKRFGKAGDNLYWSFVLRRGLYDVRAKVEWAKDVLNTLNTLDSKSDHVE